MHFSPFFPYPFTQDVIPRELHSKTAKIDDLPEVSQEKSKLG
jgi:hypothetical protein